MPAQVGPCTYNLSSQFLHGRDEKGCFIRTVQEDPSGGVRRPSLIYGLGEGLAAEAGVTVLYLERFTQRDLERGEFRGPDPLSVFQAFCTAAGLELETLVPGLWVVSTPDARENASITVFSRPVDPEKQGFLPVEQIGDMEKALINQLPVRNGCKKWPQCELGVEYYWLPEEGRDVLLVMAPSPVGMKPNPSKLFKVRLNRSGPALKVECLWASGVMGPLLADIVEDFDGDGYRDFVFNGSVYDYTANTIVSGRGGHTLLEFVGQQLLVEKGAAGAKLVATDAMWDDRWKRENLTGDEPHVFTFSAEKRAYEPVASKRPVTDVKAAAPSAEGRVARVRRELATEVGGAERVRAYLFPYEPSHVDTNVEEITVRDLERRRYITPEAIAKGMAARIWFVYK
jgi:hypothetical protein